jgi:hypothetical protein
MRESAGTHSSVGDTRLYQLPTIYDFDITDKSSSEYPISATADGDTRRHSGTASYPHSERIGRSAGPACVSKWARGPMTFGLIGRVTPK